MRTEQQFDVEVIDVDHNGNPLAVHKERKREIALRQESLSGKGRKKGKTYKSKFFLACLFVGVGLTAVSEVPLFIFLGLAIGFLFYVDPIYQKVIRAIERL